MVNTQKTLVMTLVKSIFVLVLIISLSGFSSAGLNVLNKTSYDVEIDEGEEKEEIIYLKNTEDFSFYNISFEDNDYIEMSKIDELKPNQTAKIYADIIGDESFSGDIEIEGQYHAELGQTNETYEVEVFYEDGIDEDECDLTLVEGDSVEWYNRVSDDIEISGPYNLFSGTNTIPENESKTHTFTQPGDFNYIFFREGMRFTEPCEIKIRPSEGLIINPDYNGKINLDLDVSYPPTSIEKEVSKDEYSMRLDKTQEGHITLDNVGNNSARNVRLKGKWFSFSDNNFSIESGYSKTISYKIEPYIKETSETNKTHNINVSIEGNFEKIEHPFEIFIEYAQMGSGNFTSGKSFEDFAKEFCEKNPDVCGGGTEYIYRNPNDSNFSVTYTQEDYEAFQKYIITKIDNVEDDNKYMKEEVETVGNTNDNINESIKNMANNLNLVSQQLEREREFNLASNLFLFILAISGLLGYIAFVTWKRRKFQYSTLWQPKIQK